VQGTEYTYVPGEVLQIPVIGGGSVKLEGVITRTQEGNPEWGGIPILPDDNQIVVRQRSVLIKNGQVIGEMPGTGEAHGENPGFFAHIPGQGEFVFALKHFEGAIEGTAEYGQIRFIEDGVEYMLLSGTPIAGGTQPRRVWVLHDANYVPSKHGNLTSYSDSHAYCGAVSDVNEYISHMGALRK
jgi:hypothetical protein